ncbi:MAG: tetratricopeptide repeat protein [Pirellulales bacterium]
MTGDAEIEIEGDAPGGESPSLVLALDGRHVWFVGRLGGMSRREVQALVRQHGGTMHDEYDGQSVNLVVIGADELPLGEHEDELLPDEARTAAAEGRLEIVSETTLWQRLGLVENETHVRRLYTPAMLAQLLSVSVATIRRWHRRGLIVPVREVHRLPYFDFQEVATARRLAQLVAAGASPAVIERKLAELARYVPDVERPLAQLSVIVEGRQLLLRQGEGLIEPGGQRRIDFESLEAKSASESEERGDGRRSNDDAAVLAFPQAQEPPPPADVLLQYAAQAEDDEQWETAVEYYRAALAAEGPRAEICFQLAEVLYRTGDLTAARERYFMAIELDEDYVEARANLGCLLVELGQPELAVAAFTGALQHHGDYPDAHYHLARTLDELGRRADAETHWRAFLELTPGSPWAEDARRRLGEFADEAVDEA